MIELHRHNMPREMMEELRLPLREGELRINYPPTINFPGQEPVGPAQRVIFQHNLPEGFLSHKNPLFPLSRITLLGDKDERTTKVTSGNKELRPSRYSPGNGGHLKVDLQDTWKITSDYVKGDLMGRHWLSKRPIRKWWVDWVSDVDERTKGYPYNATIFPDQEEHSHPVKLFQWLVTSTIVHQAALQRLSINQALFKRFIVGAEPISSLAIVVGTGYVLESKLGLNPGYGGLIIYPDMASQLVIDHFLGMKITRISDEIFDEIASRGPLIRLVE